MGLASDTNLPLYDNRLAEGFAPDIFRQYTQTHRGLIVVIACTLLGGVICGLNALSGPNVSFEFFYLFPVILAVWWGHFSMGIFVSLEATILGVVARNQGWMGNGSESHLADGVIRFCFYILVCSLVCRFRKTVSLERTLARTDPLTGAANGRVFYENLNAEIERLDNRGEPFTLAYLDVDDFKKVNDQLGHAAGDQVLKVIVETMLRNTRRNADTIARIGGDEFALILSETPTEKAQDVVEKLRQVLLKEMVQHNWPVTFSVGAISFCTIPGDVDALIDKVDSLMYRVKRHGKNQLCFEVCNRETGDQRPAMERRASVRVPCSRDVRITTLERAGYDKPRSCSAKTLDVSSTGLLFRCGDEFPKGTVILVAPLGPQAEVLARVARTMKDADGWLHGCQLAQLLTTDDLQRWLEPVDIKRSRSIASDQR